MDRVPGDTGSRPPAFGGASQFPRRIAGVAFLFAGAVKIGAAASGGTAPVLALPAALEVLLGGALALQRIPRFAWAAARGALLVGIAYHLVSLLVRPDGVCACFGPFLPVRHDLAAALCGGLLLLGEGARANPGVDSRPARV